MSQIIYLDHAASTPVDPEAARAMYEFQLSEPGNPSSIHRFGQQVKIRLEESRETVADFISCSPREVVFTSGGTESNSLALQGIMSLSTRKTLLISAIEHASVIETARRLAMIGVEVREIPVGQDGLIHTAALEKMVGPQVGLVSVLWVNNETGVIQPVQEIGEMCRRRGILFHCDAVQALGKISIDLKNMPVDLLSLSAHKIHGPKGVGALIIRHGIAMQYQQSGGGQESGRRAGTENLAGIIGFAEALRRWPAGTTEKIRKLSESFEQQLKTLLPNLEIIGGASPRSGFIACLAFPGTDNESLLLRLDISGLAASVGSACSSGSIRQSHVLQGMGLPAEITRSALRFSFSRTTTGEETVAAAQRIADAVNFLRRRT